MSREARLVSCEGGTGRRPLGRDREDGPASLSADCEASNLSVQALRSLVGTKPDGRHGLSSRTCRRSRHERPASATSPGC